MGMGTLVIGHTTPDHMAMALGVITARRFIGLIVMVAFILPIITAADRHRHLRPRHRPLSRRDSKKSDERPRRLIPSL